MCSNSCVNVHIHVHAYLPAFRYVRRKVDYHGVVRYEECGKAGCQNELLGLGVRQRHCLHGFLMLECACNKLAIIIVRFYGLSLGGLPYLSYKLVYCTYVFPCTCVAYTNHVLYVNVQCLLYVFPCTCVAYTNHVLYVNVQCLKLLRSTYGSHARARLKYTNSLSIIINFVCRGNGCAGYLTFLSSET